MKVIRVCYALKQRPLLLDDREFVILTVTVKWSMSQINLVPEGPFGALMYQMNPFFSLSLSRWHSNFINSVSMPFSIRENIESIVINFLCCRCLCLLHLFTTLWNIEYEFFMRAVQARTTLNTTHNRIQYPIHQQLWFAAHPIANGYTYV